MSHRYVELTRPGHDPLSIRVVDEARWDATVAYFLDCGISFQVWDDEEGNPDAVDDDVAADLVAPRDE